MRSATSSTPASAKAVGVDAVPGTLEPAPSIARNGSTPSRRSPGDRLPAAGQGGGRRGRTRDRRVGDRDRPHRPRLPPVPTEAASAFGDGFASTSSERLFPPPHRVQMLATTMATSSRSRGARLLPPAAPPEARRGGARPRADPDERVHLPDLAVRVATAAGLRNAAPRSSSSDPRPLLLPRGQHPPPGRARRDGARLGPRHRSGAALPCRPAGRSRRQRCGQRVRPRIRPHMPSRSVISAEDPGGTSRRHRARDPLGDAGRPGVRVERRSSRATVPAGSTKPDRQADGPCRRPTSGDRCSGAALDEVEI